jgi:uncharacterized cupredoxin-like copper-binding protein
MGQTIQEGFLNKLVKTSLLAATVALVTAGAALGAAKPQAKRAAKATTVIVTAGKPSEFAFTLSKKSVAQGVVTFRVTNKGAIAHDFKIAGKVTKELAAGQSGVLTVTFKKAGRYPYLCTLPSHADAGMKGVLVVK